MRNRVLGLHDIGKKKKKVIWVVNPFNDSGYCSGQLMMSLGYRVNIARLILSQFHMTVLIYCTGRDTIFSQYMWQLDKVGMRTSFKERQGLLAHDGAQDVMPRDERKLKISYSKKGSVRAERGLRHGTTFREKARGVVMESSNSYTYIITQGNECWRAMTLAGSWRG